MTVCERTDTCPHCGAMLIEIKNDFILCSDWNKCGEQFKFITIKREPAKIEFSEDLPF